MSLGSLDGYSRDEDPGKDGLVLPPELAAISLRHRTGHTVIKLDGGVVGQNLLIQWDGNLLGAGLHFQIPPTAAILHIHHTRELIKKSQVLQGEKPFKRSLMSLVMAYR